MTQPNENEESFEELLNAQENQPGDLDVSVGDTVKGKVVHIGDDKIFIDWGGKGEGFADALEYRDANGELTIKVGDQVELKLLAFGPQGAELGTKMRGNPKDKSATLRQLKEAFESKVAIEGQVTAHRKGGFDVMYNGLRVFCPLSQIVAGFCETPETFVGQTLSFRVVEFEDHGRNIVVSHRAIMEEERKAAAATTRASLVVGAEFEGQVRKLMPYGAFVDFGGLDGFVHLSEIAHQRVEAPSDVLKEGETVRVKVISLDTDPKGRERIGLSIKALALDPWQAGLPFAAGDTVKGHVRRLESFGAFVELTPGVEGLVHISEIAWERLGSPAERLKEGETIDVQIKEIDSERRRVSLSIKALLPAPARPERPEQESRQGDVIRRRSHEEHAQEAALGDVPAEPKVDYLSPRVGLSTKGLVRTIMPYGIFVDLPALGPKASGLLHMSETNVPKGDDARKTFKEGDEIEVELIRIDEKGRISLSQTAATLRREREEVQAYQNKLKSETKMGSLADKLKNIKL